MQVFFNALFNNVGHKLKTLIKVIYAIEAVGAILAGIVYFFSYIGYSYMSSMAIIGLFIAIIGPFAALIPTWFVYGFAEIVDRAVKGDSASSVIVATSETPEKPSKREKELLSLIKNDLITKDEYLKAMNKK